MGMKGFVYAALAGLVLLSPADALAQSKSSRQLVAVLDFDFGTIDRWWGYYDIGKGVSDQIVDELVNDGTFRVLERKKLGAVLGEQDLAQSDRADPSAAQLVKIGKLLGARYLLVGSITKFAVEQKGGGVRVKGIGLGGGGAKAEVNLTARLIDTSTAEVLASVKAEGSSKKATAVNFSKGGTGLNMHSSEFRESALGDAQEKACQEVVKKLVARADRLQ